MTRESAAGPIGTGMLLGMLGLALTWAVRLPFGLTALWWDRRHDVSEVGYLEWALGGWAELTASFVSICFALLVVMALARAIGEWWWIPGAAVFVAIAFAFAAVSPWLLSDLHDPATDPEADGNVRPACGSPGCRRRPADDRGGERRHQPGQRLRLRRRRNADHRPVGHAPRRALQRRAGRGRPRPRARPPLERSHRQGDRVVCALCVPWCLVADAYHAWTRRDGYARGHPARPASSSRSSASQPRRCRTGSRARWSARRTGRRSSTTRDPASARELFAGFSETSLGDPSPPTWAYVLLSTHPTLAQRVAMVEAWTAYEAKQLAGRATTRCAWRVRELPPRGV